MYYELATMTLPFGAAGQAATNVQAYAAATEAKGDLLGCWFTDIGTLNQMIVPRGFADLAMLQAERERERTQKSADPLAAALSSRAWSSAATVHPFLCSLSRTWERAGEGG